MRGLLSIDGGPSESAATPGMKKAFKFGGGLVKFALDESALRHDVRREIVRNSGDTTWITDAVIRGYTAGQVADMKGSIDAFQRMSKSKEPTSLADQLHQCTMPVRLLVGTVAHPSEVTADQRAMLGSTAQELRDRQRGGVGAVHPGGAAGAGAGRGNQIGSGRRPDAGHGRRAGAGHGRALTGVITARVRCRSSLF